MLVMCLEFAKTDAQNIARNNFQNTGSGHTLANNKKRQNRQQRRIRKAMKQPVSAKQITVILIQDREKVKKQQKQNKSSDGCHFHRHIFIGIENERNNNQREQTPHLKGKFCITQPFTHSTPAIGANLALR